MKLSELRKKHPEIKATSVKTFLEKLKAAEGLGDTLEAISEATGVKKAVEWLANGRDCGCDKRKKKLNEMFRYKPECLVESEYEWWTDYLKRHDPTRFSKTDVYEIVRLYTRIFKVRPRICFNCSSALRSMNQLVTDLNILYDEYQK